MRAIDADALIKSIESDRNCSDMPSQWIDGVNYAIDLIELYEPTIDAVSVVRCKECKWAKANGTYQWCGRLDSTARITADDYCSYGDRKDKCKECWYWSEVYKRCENKCGCQFKPYEERKESE